MSIGTVLFVMLVCHQKITDLYFDRTRFDANLFPLIPILLQNKVKPHINWAI